MNKKLRNKTLILLALIGLVSFNLKAQTSWEFKDAASGTSKWNTTTGFSAPVQKASSVVYTTLALNNPTISTATLGLVVPAEVNTVNTRQIMGLTIRVGAGGPTYLRASFPQSDSGRWYTNIVLEPGGGFKTYLINMAGYGNVAGAPGTNPRADWTNTTIDDIQLQFKTDNSTGAGANYNNAGATIEIDKIEFVNNAWDGGATPGNLNSENNGNWVFSRPVDDGTEDILIPSNLASVPNINGGMHVENFSIGAGVVITNTGSSTITVDSDMNFGVGSSFLPLSGTTVTATSVTRKISVDDDNWHLISSAVDAEQYDDTWVSANSIASGTNSNRGISTYDNGTADTDTDGAGSDTATGHWRYFQAGGGATTFGDGVGYALKNSTSSGNIFEFTGTFQSGTVSPSISQSVVNYNLLGNPFNANIDITTFITANTTKFPGAAQTIYVWDSGTSSYTGLTTGSIQPGQAFFVDSNVASSTVDFTLAMQTNTSGTFYKNSNSSINLSISDGKSVKRTSINYIDGKTQGLDPRFDIGLFKGVASDLRVYTHLLENNEGIAFERQALPGSDFESMVIPVGVKAEAGKEITFTAEALNLPSGLKVFLEDRQEGVFTQLDVANAEYKVSLSEVSNGTGRFFLHTRSSALSTTDDVFLNSISIFKSSANTLKIAGLKTGKVSVSLFNILGKQVMSKRFTASSKAETLTLPNVAKGVYVVQLTTEHGKLNKKIILE